MDNGPWRIYHDLTILSLGILDLLKQPQRIYRFPISSGFPSGKAHHIFSKSMQIQDYQGVWLWDLHSHHDCKDAPKKAKSPSREISGCSHSPSAHSACRGSVVGFTRSWWSQPKRWTVEFLLNRCELLFFLLGRVIKHHFGGIITLVVLVGGGLQASNNNGRLGAPPFPENNNFGRTWESHLQQ